MVTKDTKSLLELCPEIQGSDSGTIEVKDQLSPLAKRSRGCTPKGVTHGECFIASGVR